MNSYILYVCVCVCVCFCACARLRAHLRVHLRASYVQLAQEERGPFAVTTAPATTVTSAMAPAAATAGSGAWRASCATTGATGRPARVRRPAGNAARCPVTTSDPSLTPRPFRADAFIQSGTAGAVMMFIEPSAKH